MFEWDKAFGRRGDSSLKSLFPVVFLKYDILENVVLLCYTDVHEYSKAPESAQGDYGGIPSRNPAVSQASPWQCKCFYDCRRN